MNGIDILETISNEVVDPKLQNAALGLCFLVTLLCILLTVFGYFVILFNENKSEILVGVAATVAMSSVFWGLLLGNMLESFMLEDAAIGTEYTYKVKISEESTFAAFADQFGTECEILGYEDGIYTIHRVVLNEPDEAADTEKDKK